MSDSTSNDPKQRLQRQRDLFDQALQRPAPERDAWLASECADDVELLAVVRALLVADAQWADHTARPALPGLSDLVDGLSREQAHSGRRVGPFELREEIGRGGMGTVYRGERVDGSVVQQVAVKFLRRDALDATALRRFQLERQTLALLDHPNIARLFDSGELADGTPYYVMEHIVGVPITDYCRQQALGVAERILLLRTVCSAVTHAHRNLIVHRDIKPGNLLVNAAGVPKLLDFGIAKPLALEGVVAAQEHTGTAQRYFSPLYAAPEQLLGEPIGVGCDVYALGLLAYELLSGTRPFDFTGLSAGEIEHLVRTVPPDAPSRSAARAGIPAIRPPDLRGDLDDIVLRCLRKAPSERYASVEQLEADLGNYLDGRPVVARGGHAWYRLRKFVARNAVAVTSAGVVALAIAGGIAAFAWQAEQTRRRATELETVAGLQNDILNQVDPTELGKQLRSDVHQRYEHALAEAGVAPAERAARLAELGAAWDKINATDVSRALLDHAILSPTAKAIEQKLGDQPLLQADLETTLAARYESLEILDSAEAPLLRATATFRRLLGNRDRSTLHAIDHLAAHYLQRGKLEQAEVYGREAVAGELAEFGPDDPSTLIASNRLAETLRSRGKLAEAEPLFRDVLERRRRLLGGDDPQTVKSVSNLAFLLRTEGKLKEAEPLMREVLSWRRTHLGDDDPATMVAINNIGLLLDSAARYAEAEPFYLEALERRRRVLGEENSDTLTSMNNLGQLWLSEGRHADGEKLLRQALGVQRRILGDLHPHTLRSINNLGFALMEIGKLDEAAELMQEAIDGHEKAVGDGHINTLKAKSTLARIRNLQGRPADALALLEPVTAAARQAAASSEPPFLGRFLVNIGRARLGLRDFAGAESALREAQTISTTVEDVPVEDLHESTAALVALYQAWRQADPAVVPDDRAAEWRSKLAVIEHAHPELAGR